MKKLSEYAENRNNNFNLIRLSAAISVLYGHCFPLSTGKEATFWIGNYLGISFGSVAVDVFFITSGYLVTGSLLSRMNAFKFFLARVLRVYPGLIVMLLVTVPLIGSYFTKLSSLEFLTHGSTYWYILKNASLVTGAVYDLPGVFENNPYKGSFNGSLWTLPYEVWMYITLAAIWLAIRLSSRREQQHFVMMVVLLAVISLVACNYLDVSDSYYQFMKFFAMFFSGSAYFVLRRRIAISLPSFFAIAFVVGLSMLDKSVFHVVYSLSLPFLVMCLAYLPNGLIRSYNLVGDYSYGIYIYAFPIQQSVAAYFPGISITNMFFIALFATSALAILSWHLIEKPFLAIKGIPIVKRNALAL